MHDRSTCSWFILLKLCISLLRYCVVWICYCCFCFFLLPRLASLNYIYIFGRPFVKRFALCYQSVVMSDLSVCLSVCNVRALWPNGWTDQDETWRAGRPRPWPHCIRWGPSSPPPKGHSPPIFGPYPLLPNGCIDQDCTWYGGRPQPRATLC